METCTTQILWSLLRPHWVQWCTCTTVLECPHEEALWTKNFKKIFFYIYIYLKQRYTKHMSNINLMRHLLHIISCWLIALWQVKICRNNRIQESRNLRRFRPFYLLTSTLWRIYWLHVLDVSVFVREIMLQLWTTCSKCHIIFQSRTCFWDDE